MTMIVVTSILLAALVGGLVFTLLDGWQRRAAASEREPEWPPDTWMSDAHTVPLPRDRSEELTAPLPGEPPPAPRRPLWDDPARDDEDPPPGLWSGWAR
jgi:hypothetical protein